MYFSSSSCLKLEPIEIIVTNVYDVCLLDIFTYHFHCDKKKKDILLVLESRLMITWHHF